MVRFRWHSFSYPIDGCLLAVSLYGLSLVHAHQESDGSLFLFLWDWNPIGLGTHLYDLFNLDYLLKALSPNIVTKGVRVLANEFWRGAVHVDPQGHFSHVLVRRLIWDNVGKSSFSYTGPNMVHYSSIVLDRGGTW